MKTELEAQIFQDPDNPNNYGVYADWLSEQGDPRGEFIRVQLRLESDQLTPDQRQDLARREAELMEQYGQQWLGAYAEHLTDIPTVEHPEEFGDCPLYTYRFQRGFLAELQMARLGVNMARTLRDADESRFLRKLQIDYIAAADDLEYWGESWEPGDDLPNPEEVQFFTVHALLASQTPLHEKLCSLESLQIGNVWAPHEQIVGGFSCHCYCKPLTDLVAQLPNIRHLKLYCKDYDIDRLVQLPMPKLETLEIYHAGVRSHQGDRSRYAYPLDLLADNATLGNLKSLLLHPHHEEYHRDHYGQPQLPSFLPLDQVEALLKSPHIRQLEQLQLRLSNAGDTMCDAIVSSKCLDHLQSLDLRHGRLTDEGGRRLVEWAIQRGLRRLDLSRNALSEDGVESLSQSFPSLRADRQLTAHELEQEAYLYEGDSE